MKPTAKCHPYGGRVSPLHFRQTHNLERANGRLFCPQPTGGVVVRGVVVGVGGFTCPPTGGQRATEDGRPYNMRPCRGDR
ncbi:MAG: hypothetical protein FWG68_05255, partial [Defluviitaleaceae bacterium]|nr:hypothetical protein [Defluviitaleaceae bacterium]